MNILDRAAVAVVQPSELRKLYAVLNGQDPGVDSQLLAHAYFIGKQNRFKLDQQLGATFRVEALMKLLESERFQIWSARNLGPDTNDIFPRVFEVASKARLSIGEYEAEFDVEDFLEKLSSARSRTTS